MARAAVWSRSFRLGLVVGLATVAARAQATWTVCASGGPQAQFSSIAAALAVAADGDTIVCLPPQFGMALTGFTTNKGVTIVGAPGFSAIPLYADSNAPIVVQGLPAGRTFRMAGFQFVQDGQLRIDLQSCAGHVHVESVSSRDIDFFFPNQPSVTVQNCASVVLRNVRTFGVPAVRIDGSRAILERCGLGVPIAGVRGGRGLVAVNGSEVDLVQCEIDTGSASTAPGVYVPAVETTNCILRIAGDATARVTAAAPGTPGGVPVVANGGSVVVDPLVRLQPGLGQPPILASGSAAVQPVAATWSSEAVLGGPIDLVTAVAPGGVAFLAVGAAGPITASPLGPIGIDLGLPYSFFAFATPGPTGVVLVQTVVPAGLPLGTAFAAQAAVITGGVLEVSIPSAFVVL